MPKPKTYTSLYNDVKYISITNLKKWGYLIAEQSKIGVLNWSRDGVNTGSIGISSNMHIKPYIELDYKVNNKEQNYKIDLVCIASNLGKGKIWYFLCPYTQKRCRKLYLKAGLFVHREAFKGIMYESQTYSKRSREVNRALAVFVEIEKLYLELEKKNFKKTYKGKPTKRYLEITKRLYKSTKPINFKEVFRYS